MEINIGAALGRWDHLHYKLTGRRHAGGGGGRKRQVRTSADDMMACVRRCYVLILGLQRLVHQSGGGL